MQYRINPKNGDEISALGFGCMRFSRDEQEVEKHIRYAVEKGVNYFDTAYIYSGNEAVLGKILKKTGLRDQINLATKLPQFLVKKTEDAERFFSTELERLQTSYIDYYLMHMLTGLSDWRRLVEMGIIEWIALKQASGAIRNIGFSFHGPQSEFKAILDEYDWDFCMIQYNYYDEFNQAGRGGLAYAGEKGVPVMVMEPLRGGHLVHKLPEKARAVWECAPVKRSPADWGLRWVLNHPEVLCVLSGMNSMEMIKENIDTATNARIGELSEDELKLFQAVREKILETTKVTCTGCGYCMPCPHGVDIPSCFTKLNDTVNQGKLMSKYWYAVTVKGQNASKCIKCGKCEKNCPQSIAIREKLEQTKRELERFPYGLIRSVMGRFMHIR